MKGRAKTKLQDLIAGIKNGTIQIGGNEPKMSIRALRTLLLSEDKVHGELVEEFLSGKLTTEEFKNKLRGASETRVPKPLRRLPTDRIHHLTPLEIAGIIEEMPDNELLNLLQDYEKDSIWFGDSDPNVRGGSFDERAHTGARPKASKSKIVYPNQLGEDGLREMSAHPRGTRDKMFDIPDRPTTAVEARGVINPLLEQGQEDIQRGIIADTPRRDYINNELVRQGVIEQGTDIFSADIDDATLKRAKPFLQSAELQEGAAKAFKTPSLELGGGSIKFRRGQAAMGTAAGLAGIGWLGTPASAYETHVRKSISDETKNPIDQFQTAVSGVSLAADAFGPKGEFVSTPADMLNEGIDDTRTLLSDPVEYLKNKAADVVGNPLMNPLDMVKMAMPGTQENNAVLGVVNGSINWFHKQWDNHYLNEDKEEESPISAGFAEGGF